MNLVCTVCKKEKDVGLFTSNKNKPNGKMSYCKECNNIRNKKYRRDSTNLLRACKRVYGYLQRRVRIKNLEVDFGPEFLVVLYEQQQGLCAYTNLMNKLLRCFDLAAPDRVVDQMFAQFVGLGFSDPISLTSRAADYAVQMDTIERLKVAPVNWSMAIAVAPSEEQALVARDALIAMMFASLPAPLVMLLDGGTLGAYWKRDGMYASIDFDQDGEFPWTVADGNIIGSGIWSISQSVPQELRTALRA